MDFENKIIEVSSIALFIVTLLVFGVGICIGVLVTDKTWAKKKNTDHWEVEDKAKQIKDLAQEIIDKIN